MNARVPSSSNEIKQLVGGGCGNGGAIAGTHHHSKYPSTKSSSSRASRDSLICQAGSPDYPAVTGLPPPTLLPNRNLIKIGNGQIISLSDLKVRKSCSIRKSTFKCLSSQIISDNFDNDSCGGTGVDSSQDSSAGRTSTRSNSVLFKLVFSTKYICEEDMNYIYLGSTLVNVMARKINNEFYVNSFRKIDTHQNRDEQQQDPVMSRTIVAPANESHFGRTSANSSQLDSALVDERNYRDLFQRLPKDIAELYEYCTHSSPYSFLFSMAYVFANNIAKSGSFFRLKLALMLSLVSQAEQPKNNCSLLVVCDDDLVIGRLLQWAANLAKKHFLYSSWLHSLAGSNSGNSTGSLSAASSGRDMPMQLPVVMQFGEASQPFTQPLGPFIHFVNGGTLDLAADGIHVFSNAVNLTGLSAKERTFLEHALESNEIIPKELKATTVEISESKLKSIIWANISYSQNMASGANKLAKGMQAVLTSMVTNKPQADWTAPGKGTKSRWMFLFGTVVMVPDAGLWLPDQQRTISIEDWQVYLELAEAINPSLHPEAEDIVRQYFLLNRSHRPANEFPAKSLSILFCQSKCIAKLNLRNEVTRHDALLAVMLYEQQLQQLFPHSMSPIVFPLRDLTHIVEEEEEERTAAVEENSRDTGSVNNNKMNQCSSTLSSGPQSEQAGQQHYQNMSSLLDDSYMNSFECKLMDLFVNKAQHHQQQHQAASVRTTRVDVSTDSNTNEGNNENDNLQVQHRAGNNNRSGSSTDKTNNNHQHNNNNNNNDKGNYYYYDNGGGLFGDTEQNYANQAADDEEGNYSNWNTEQ